jgi:hypothetical protein
MVKVIVRHLRKGFNLIGAEVAGKGFRFDLLFRLSPSGKTRLVEVKSSRQIKEAHKIQGALYRQYSNADEIVVSNRETDEILTVDFINDVLARARDLYAMDPKVAATTFTPQADCCSTCANMKCPYRRDGLA